MGQGEVNRFICCGDNPRIAVFDVHLSKTGCIPELIDKAAVAVNALLVHLDFAPLGGKGGQGEAEGISSVLGNRIHGINHVTGGFGHLLTVLIPHQSMEIDIPERNFVHKV